MSETELSVICKNCGSEVSPYVTECPYCGARLRKRAPKLERRGDALEPREPRRKRRRVPRLGRVSFPVSTDRPYATISVVLASAILLLLQKATGYGLVSFGGVIVPFEDDWWRYLSAPFAYLDVGYLFVVAIALAIFGTGIERRLGAVPTLALLVACGSLGVLAAAAVADSQNDIELIAGGNGMALGVVAAWFVIRHGEARGSIGDEYDRVGVAVSAGALLLLPIFASSANWWAGLAGGAVGAISGLLVSAFHRSE